jgi:hypothetical protein
MFSLINVIALIDGALKLRIDKLNV